MPNPITHVDIALESVVEFRHPSIEANLGSYLLGSCAPDIRVITHGHRDDTHFAPLSNQVIGTGTKNMFKAYPRLGEAANLSERTQAFMAGYISHLVADEAWITQVYRPYFGNQAVFQDPVMAKVVDRAVQMDMDRMAIDGLNGMAQVRDHLADAHVGVQVDFLPAESLAEWEEWLSGVTQRGFTWERLRRMAIRRQEPQDHEKAQEIAEQFLKTMPDSLERLYDLVPREAVRSYRAAIVQEWSKIVREYLP